MWKFFKLNHFNQMESIIIDIFHHQFAFHQHIVNLIKETTSSFKEIIENKFTKVTKQYFTFSEEMKAMKTNNINLQNQLTEKEERQIMIEKANSKLETELSLLQKWNFEFKQQHELEKQLSQNIEKQLSQNNQQKANLEKTNQEYQSKIFSLTNELNNIKNQNQIINKEKNDLFQKNQTLQNQISKLNQPQYSILQNDLYRGIFFKLYKENSLDIMSSTVYSTDPRYQLYNLFTRPSDPNSYYFYSQNSPNQYIEVSLREKSIIPTAYLLQGRTDYYLKNWKLEGLGENLHWDTLDTQTNQELLNLQYKHFPLKYEKKIKIFRLTQTGPNKGNFHSLYLASFDVFGYLY
jgi:hypothetical protein